MISFKEFLKEANMQGHFALVSAAGVGGIDSTLGSIARDCAGSIRKKYKVGHKTVYVLSFKTKSDADKAIDAINGEDLELVKNIVYTDDLMKE